LRNWSDAAEGPATAPRRRIKCEARTTTAFKFAHNIHDSFNNYDVWSRQTTNTRYSADLKLMATVTHFDSLRIDTHQVVGVALYDEIEEYRYDALGRRIWRRLERPSLCSLMNKASGCLSVVERTVWDGAQTLADIRTDGAQGKSGSILDCDVGCASRSTLEGKAVYTFGGGLDHPLSVSRSSYNEVVIPVYNWRGRPVSGICVNGSTFCTDFQWPAQLEDAFFRDPGDPPVVDPIYGGPPAWGGNLLDTQKDGSGLVYKRNRYYDPASGRFTQVDPIGLGGGLNSYGFAGGDPVSYSDPFGTGCINAKGTPIACPPGMASEADGQKIVQAARSSGEWTYSQFPNGGNGPAAAKEGQNLGDCTDFTKGATKAGLSGQWNHDKSSTTNFVEGDHPGYVEVSAADAQVGDVVVSKAGGHAGIVDHFENGKPVAYANNGSPGDTSGSEGKGYHDGTTGRFEPPPGSHYYRAVKDPPTPAK